ALQVCRVAWWPTPATRPFALEARRQVLKIRSMVPRAQKAAVAPQTGVMAQKPAPIQMRAPPKQKEPAEMVRAVAWERWAPAQAGAPAIPPDAEVSMSRA